MSSKLSNSQALSPRSQPTLLSQGSSHAPSPAAVASLPTLSTVKKTETPHPRIENPEILKTLRKQTVPELLKLLLASPLSTLQQWCLDSSVMPCGPTKHKTSYANPLLESFWHKFCSWAELDDSHFRHLARNGGSRAQRRSGQLYDKLQTEFPMSFLRKIMLVKSLNRNSKRRVANALAIDKQLEVEDLRLSSLRASWPTPVSEEVVLQRCSEYVAATTIVVRKPCVACGRACHSAELLTPNAFSFAFGSISLPQNHPLRLLQASDTFWHYFIPTFSHHTPLLDGIMLFHAYINVDDASKVIRLSLCHQCDRSLASARVPRFSLKNNLFRGYLPQDLKDITWLEEKICALHRLTADVARLHYAESDETASLRLIGNICSHPANVASTAEVLPRTPSDINGHLTVVFVGHKFDKKKLPPMFRVRRKVIARFLIFLASSNPLYTNIPVNQDFLAMYPEDDFLPGLADAVIQTSPTVMTQVEQEFASFEAHPFETLSSSRSKGEPNDSPSVIIESTGVVDFTGTTISGHSAVASAIYNLLRPRHEGDPPDLILPRGQNPIREYNNPDLLPGMFPTLFPFGIAGVEAQRDSPISFQEHCNYLLSLHDPCFKYHRFFMFVVLNIIKRRKNHLEAAFTVQKPSFRRIADTLANISAEVLEATARHLEKDGAISAMSEEQRQAYSCLRQLNITSARLTGSPGAKIRDRASIRGYFGIFGLPHIFLTFNPSAALSPIFQVFFGDEEVDLSRQFPTMPSRQLGHTRVAKDPVAAADFFVFCVKMFFKHLLGYDMDSGESKGGILGHVKAFYGKCECTNRACLHGHFVIWLLGGLNPRQIHEKLEGDPEFRTRFFQFWEEIVKHDSPHQDIHVPETFEPRMQRPPPIDADWDSVFPTEVRYCSEKLQRHQCQEVCWKYSNVSHLPRELRPCRFHFPHEYVAESHYDAATKSVVMACRDPTLNYYNPYISVFCRHNHDIKNILSGKSAKAAMFYITNYITKDDIRSHQMLTMMSSTIAHMDENKAASPLDRAKARLQRWLSQLARLHEIHAQQAVMELRGIGDTFSSHSTIPMMSSMLVEATNCLQPEEIEPAGTPPVDSEHDPSLHDTEAVADERANVPLRRARNGSIYTDVSQIDDYLDRGESLSEISFFEFVCCYRKQKRRGLSAVSGLHSYPRHNFAVSHPQYSSHLLIEVHAPSLSLDQWKTPPCLIGMQVPRQDAGHYHQFMLAHFKPFSRSMPLKQPSESYADAFDAFLFPQFAQTIMQNWEDVHECEDERDADRIQRKQTRSRQNAELEEKLAALKSGGLDEEDASILVDLNSDKQHRRDGILLQMIETLRLGGWFSFPASSDVPSSAANLPKPTSHQIKVWSAELRTQEDNTRASRSNSSPSQAPEASFDGHTMSVPKTLQGLGLDISSSNVLAPKTVAPAKSLCFETPEHIMMRIGNEMTLNQEQWIAYLIPARKFLSDLVAHSDGQPRSPPVRLLLTGPGGTGKSHVVNSLRKLMAAYGCENRLRLLAPTGSTASVIDATTIHKGLGIRVKRPKDRATEKHEVVVEIPKAKRLLLEEEWGPADFVFCDEFSMLGAALNAEFDQMLRVVKRNAAEWYGGVSVLFAGDFAQYPPVRATPLFQSISAKSGSKTNNDFLSRLGRLAWKSFNDVVELTIQNRMGDIDLFNSRVVSHNGVSSGVVLSADQSVQATTIVKDNRTRLYLNSLKAFASPLSDRVVECAARDFHHDGSPLTGDEKLTHLKHDFASTIAQGGLPSSIVLAVGMQVTLRQRNISTELKIANGSMGIIVQLFTTVEQGTIHADGVIVHFPKSPVQLVGLPQGCIYLEPATVTYQIKKGARIVKFTRKQLQVEPAYVVTGHFAQGKTLPVVIADLKQGGYAAYVAASRPTSRYGLFLLKPLRLEDLNKPKHHVELLKEFKRLEALAHNTLIKHGFSKGQIVDVPDAESEHSSEKQHSSTLPTARKRKWSECRDTQPIPSERPRKRPRSMACSSPTLAVSASSLAQYAHPYLRWDAENYSCGYDTILTSLFFSWAALSPPLQDRLANYSSYLRNLLPYFHLMLQEDSIDAQRTIFEVREQLRDTLALLDVDSQNPRFPRLGPSYVGMDDLFNEIGLHVEQQYHEVATCSVCRHHAQIGPYTRLYHLFYPGSSGMLPNETSRHKLQSWVDAQLGLRNLEPALCVECGRRTEHSIGPEVSTPLAILTFHTNHRDQELKPSLELAFPRDENAAVWTYRLTSLIFYRHADHHYISRLMSRTACWDYNGMETAPRLRCTLPSETTTTFLDTPPGCSLSYLVYILVEDGDARPQPLDN